MDLAIKHFEKLLKTKNLNSQTKTLLLGNLGVVYFYKFDHQSALSMLNQALNTIKEKP